MGCDTRKNIHLVFVPSSWHTAPETPVISRVLFATTKSLSQVWLFVTPWTAAHQASMSITVSMSLLKLMSIISVISSNHLILCHPLLLLPSIFPIIRIFSNESVIHIRTPKYWTFSFSISSTKEYSGFISFRIDCFDLLAVPGTLKSLIQHHSSEASILRRTAFFTVQRSHPYTAMGKTIAFTRQTFVGKVMSLLLNMLSSLVIPFLPRSKCLNFMGAVTICRDFGALKRKSCHCFHFFPHLFAMKWWDQMPWSQFFECWVLSL